MPNQQYVPPGGVGAPWNTTPPDNSTPGGPPQRGIIPGYLYHPLPADPGAGATPPQPGDTQTAVPAAPAAPQSPTYAFQAGQPLVVRYLQAGASVTATTEGHPSPPMRIYLGAGAAGPGVPGSVRFTFRGRTYVDRGGSLYYDIDPATNAGTLGGTYDYSTNTATLTSYGTGANTVSIVSLATRYTEFGVSGVMFRAPGSPLSEGSFTLRATTMEGAELTGSADINGAITGASMKGQVDWATGLARIVFGDLVTAAGNETQPWYNADIVDVDGKIWRPLMVDPGSVFFGAVLVQSIPVDPSLIGIDPVRMPSDGRVLGFNPGWPAVVSHTAITTDASPTAGAAVNLGRERLGFAEVYDASGKPVDQVWYTLDLDDGLLTWANPLNLSAYTLPIRIRHRIHDIALVADVQITGEITLATPLTHDYPPGTIVSGSLLFDTTQARITNVFDQQTYQPGVWSDVVVGAPAAGTYNTVLYPFEVGNDAAIDERWAIVFRSPTTVDVIGEKYGQVLSGVSISDDIAPINPATVSLANPGGKPFFTIRKEGWGGGWAAQNLVRFNALSATRPLWLARVVTPGEITHPNDATRINTYGNAH